jgi:osmotically-inducible protein OsmY
MQTAPQSMEQRAARASDADITRRQVEERLWKSVDLRAVEVSTHRGVVILTGNVPSFDARARASGIVRTIPRVGLVTNELTHDPDGSRRGPSAGIRSGPGGAERGSAGTSLERFQRCA